VKLPTLAALVASVLVVAGLAGCRTNVNTAAVIDGHRVTETEVNQYLTPNAQPVSERDQNGGTSQISPRSFVVAQLINERLGFKILAAIPSVSDVTAAQLDAQLQSDLAGKSVTEVAETLGLHGYTEDFYKIVLRVQELSGVLRNAQQNGVDVSKAINSVSFPVSVSPRYGRWDANNLQFSSGVTVPGYLDVRPGSHVPLQVLPSTTS
jgi:hypothetical protein